MNWRDPFTLSIAGILIFAFIGGYQVGTWIGAAIRAIWW